MLNLMTFLMLHYLKFIKLGNKYQLFYFVRGSVLLIKSLIEELTNRSLNSRSFWKFRH